MYLIFNLLIQASFKSFSKRVYLYYNCKAVQYKKHINLKIVYYFDSIGLYLQLVQMLRKSKCQTSTGRADHFSCHSLYRFRYF